MRSSVGLPVSLALLLSACASAQVVTPRALPRDQAERRDSVGELARSLVSALVHGSLKDAVARPSELDGLITPEARFRIERERSALSKERGAQDRFRKDWGSATYAGFCAQGAREEPALGSTGLRAPAWMIDRLLLVVDQHGARSAAWISGRFVYTSAGFRVFSVTAIEAPRRHHADLELAPCDLSEGTR